MTDTMREAFQTLYQQQFPHACAVSNKFLRDNFDEYEDVYVQVGWKIFKACEAANEPIGKILSESEIPVSYDRRAGNVIWWDKPKGPAMLYSAPLDAKAIEQRGYVRAIEDAAAICEETYVEPGDLQVETCHAAAKAIRALIKGSNQS